MEYLKKAAKTPETDTAEARREVEELLAVVVELNIVRRRLLRRREGRRVRPAFDHQLFRYRHGGGERVGKVTSAIRFMALFTTATVPVLLTWGVGWLRRRGELVKAGDRDRAIIVVTDEMRRRRSSWMRSMSATEIMTFAEMTTPLSSTRLMRSLRTSWSSS